jgi:hypothetical protein
MDTPELREHLIGYDAREYWTTFAESWSDERKKAFLYRLDLLKPLSIDTRVWSTIFEAEERVPPGHVGILGAWADLFDLRDAVTQAFQEKPMRAWRTIAITLLLDPYNKDEQELWTPRLVTVNPDQRETEWTFLGYDVGDQWMLSALSNCGFLEGLDDVAALRGEWGPLLNEFHLFPNVGDAFRFKQFSNERLRDDHAPCFVYGLWIVK